MKSGESSFFALEPWVKEMLVDPLSKSPLMFRKIDIQSDYGRTYQYTEGGSVPDLRLYGGNEQGVIKQWREGQTEYEDLDLVASSCMSADEYIRERDGVAEVYDDIKILGRCIDIAGHQGRLRAFLEDGQEYVTVDAFTNPFVGVKPGDCLFKAYPQLNQPMNFVLAMAEHLPFASNSFDTAHMRSCIDHFLNPELAVLEAYRVLRPGGRLIVGLYVEGGRTGRIRFYDAAKERAKHLLGLVLKKYQDHHLWHPTYPDLCAMLHRAGFSLERTHWQKGHDDSVCYVLAVKG